MFADVAYAATYSSIVKTVETNITQGYIPLVAGAAVIFFFWGLVKYLANSDSAGERERGRKYMLWALIGLLVLFAVWGFVGLLSSLLGVSVHIPQFTFDAAAATSRGAIIG